MSELIVKWMDDNLGGNRASITVDGKLVVFVQRFEVRQEGVKAVASMDIVDVGGADKQGFSKALQYLRTIPFLHVNVLRNFNDDDGPPWSETDRVT